MYRCSFAPKNCVVTISPISPYHAGSDQSAGSFWNAPRGCLSNPTTRPISYAPDCSVWNADTSDEPPVAQPFFTLMNGTPVGPRSATIVSALPASSLPPYANSTSSHV